MEYMLLLVFDARAWRALTARERSAAHRRIGRWFAGLNASGRLVHSRKLSAGRTAKTLEIRGGETFVRDGPFSGTEKVIRAYAVVDVPDVDAAVEVAKTWPDPNGTVEIRRVGA